MFLGDFCKLEATFPATFGFSGPWRPPPALSSTLATFSCFTFARLFHHSFTASATVLSGHFLPTGVFYLALILHILAHFCLPSQSCPFRLTHGLELLIYKTIGLPIAPQWATKYRASKLFNKFQSTYAWLKTIKRLWTILINKYCLKLLQRNCFLSIHQS